MTVDNYSNATMTSKPLLLAAYTFPGVLAIHEYSEETNCFQKKPIGIYHRVICQVSNKQYPRFFLSNADEWNCPTNKKYISKDYEFWLKVAEDEQVFGPFMLTSVQGKRKLPLPEKLPKDWDPLVLTFACTSQKNSQIHGS